MNLEEGSRLLVCSYLWVIFYLRRYQLGLEESLACLEHHLIVNREQFIDEQPCSIGALFLAVAVRQNPAAIVVLDETVQAAQLSVFKPDVTTRHTPNQHLLVG